jgi:hypothetical protein
MLDYEIGYADKAIDALVHQLYGLTEEPPSPCGDRQSGGREIKIVEGG